MGQLLIAAAFGPELQPITQLVGFSSSVRTIAVGIGMIEAAANTGYLLSLNPEQSTAVRGLIFVGSCGAADKSIPIGSVVIATEARLSDESLAHGKAYLPEQCTSRIAAAGSMVEVLRNNIRGDVLCEPVYSSVAISRSEAVGLTHRRYCGSRIENMEIFGVAIACRNQSIPWVGLSIVTNHTWERGHQEWNHNHHSAARKTSEILVPLLPKLSA